MWKEQIARLVETTVAKRFAQVFSSMIKGEYALLTFAAAIAVVAVVTIWISIQQAQPAILKMHATENAHAWASILTDEIDQLPNILAGRPLTANEQKQAPVVSGAAACSTCWAASGAGYNFGLGRKAWEIAKGFVSRGLTITRVPIFVMPQRRLAKEWGSRMHP